MCNDLEIRCINAELEQALIVFFTVLENAKEDDFFLPHPLTSEYASNVAHYSGKDFYAAVLYRETVIAYGLLRGWDEGYETPGLGISVHPEFRRGGVGLAMMYYLHAVAALRGCDRVRLRVNKNNIKAKSLYMKLGYRFEEENESLLTGFFELKKEST